MEELDTSKEVNTSKNSKVKKQPPGESEAKDKTGKLKRDLCRYSCKKQSFMNKHIKLNHEGHKCSDSEINFKTMSELLKHKILEHNERKQESDIIHKIEYGSEDFNGTDQDINFVYSESMLDEFDV